MTKSRFWCAADSPKYFLYCCWNLFLSLDYPKTAVLPCNFAIEYMFFFQNSSLQKRRHINILRVYRIHSRINIWTGKVIINWNHYKSMLATIHTMFVNKNIFRIYSSCPFSQWSTWIMHFKRSIMTETETWGKNST